MPELTPEEVAARSKPQDPGPPPSLPEAWTAAALLFPFGDADPTMPNYDQVTVANIEYDWSQRMMRVSLYLLEDLKYFDFLFDQGNGVWYWLASYPGQKPTGYFGPFLMNRIHVPAPDFLANKAQFANSWPICGVSTDAWLIPTAPQPGVPPHGTWFSVKQNSTAFWRILNLDNDNPVGIPILGSYYLAYLPGFKPRGPLNLRSLISGTRYPGAPKAGMLTQRDIQTNLADPLDAAQCTLADIQVVVPGISYPSTQPPLPEWTDKTYIQGMTIGCDPIPYLTTVRYWWSYKHMRTEFIGYVGDGTGTYNNRMDTVLYSNFTTIPVYQRLAAGQWVWAACQPCIPGVGLPRPDFVRADGGVVKAVVAGNPDFNASPGQSISMIRVSMPRGGGVTSVFWFWFDNDQNGILFSEGNFMNTVTAHDLQVIDYDYFARNAPARLVYEGSFEDPCHVDECKAQPATTGVTRRFGF